MEAADWLATELPRWQAAGLVTADTARAIAALYASRSPSPLPTRPSPSHQSPAIALAEALAAVAVLLAAAAVVRTPISSLGLGDVAWARLAWYVQAGVVLAVVAGAHACALRMRATSAAELCALLASLVYGAGSMMLVGKEAAWQDGVWWWAAGVLPAALALGSKPCHVLLCVLVAVWTVQTTSARRLAWGEDTGDTGDTLAALPLLLPGLVWVHGGQRVLLLGAYVCVGTLWLLVTPGLDVVTASTVWTAILGMAFVGAALWIPVRRPASETSNRALWRVLYQGLGVTLTAFALFWMSFAAVWDWGVATAPGNRPFLNATSTAVATLTLVAYYVTLRRAAHLHWQTTALRDAIPVAVSAACVGLVVLGGSSSAVVAAAVSNVCALLLMLYAFHLAVAEARPGMFLLGVGSLVCWTLARYAEWFHVGTRDGMLGAAFVLLVAAAAVAGHSKQFAVVVPIEHNDVAGAHCPTHHAVLTQHNDVIGSRPVPTPKQNDGGRTGVRSVPLPTPHDDVLRNAHSVQVPDDLPGARPLLIPVTGPGRGVVQSVLQSVVAVLQLSVLGGLVVRDALPYLVGTNIVLQAGPVYARDLRRGGNVDLVYDVGAFAKQAFTSHEWLACVTRQCNIYVTVEPDLDRLLWRPTAASLAPPAVSPGAVYLRGRATWSGVAFGIETVYVDKGVGEAYARQGQLTARVKVAPWGQARSCGLQ